MIEELLNHYVMCYSINYIDYGRVVAVCNQWLKLSEPELVYQTGGHHDWPKWRNSEKYPVRHIWVNTDNLERLVDFNELKETETLPEIS